jgi:hypothetical protein
MLGRLFKVLYENSERDFRFALYEELSSKMMLDEPRKRLKIDQVTKSCLFWDIGKIMNFVRIFQSEYEELKKHQCNYQMVQIFTNNLIFKSRYCLPWTDGHNFELLMACAKFRMYNQSDPLDLVKFLRNVASHPDIAYSIQNSEGIEETFSIILNANPNFFNILIKEVKLLKETVDSVSLHLTMLKKTSRNLAKYL